jgi:hypothetical protein
VAGFQKCRGGVYPLPLKLLGRRMGFGVCWDLLFSILELKIELTFKNWHAARINLELLDG